MVVFLVRHGENADLSEDAELSAAGAVRATVLATTLRSAEIEHIHSTDFIRTRETVIPTAAEYGLDVELYDPRDLFGLIEKMRKTGGRHLVVGHTITIPPTVELLEGKPGSAIKQEEYDRLYIVNIARDGTVSSLLMRYGKPYESNQD